MGVYTEVPAAVPKRTILARVSAQKTPERVIPLEGSKELVDTLRARGYRVVGPTLRDGAIVYDELESADELPAGWTEIHDPGSYRVEQRDDEARFGFTVGPHSWKQFLFRRVYGCGALAGTARSRRSRRTRRPTSRSRSSEFAAATWPRSGFRTAC